MIGPCGDRQVMSCAFETLLWFSCGWPRAGTEYVTWALKVLIQRETPSGIASMLLEVCDRAHRCHTAHKQALNLLVLHSYNLSHATHRPRAQPAYESTDNFESAIQTLCDCMEVFLDDHKERAFTSAFIAPARYYLVQTGHEFEQMLVHGTNAYVALLNSTLGVQLTFQADYEDVVFHAVDFWRGMTEEAWAYFSDADRFGKFMSGCPRLPELTFIQRIVQEGQLPEGQVVHGRVKHLANDAVHPGEAYAQRRRGIALYLERFAYFFRADFFVRKAFETLNSEMRAEYVGFRRAAETLFDHYQKEVLGNVGESLLEHCYPDEYMMHLDVDRVRLFFAWLGIVRLEERTPEAKQRAEEAAAVADTLHEEATEARALAEKALAGLGVAKEQAVARMAAAEATLLNAAKLIAVGVVESVALNVVDKLAMMSASEATEEEAGEEGAAPKAQAERPVEECGGREASTGSATFDPPPADVSTTALPSPACKELAEAASSEEVLKTFQEQVSSCMSMQSAANLAFAGSMEAVDAMKLAQTACKERADRAQKSLQQTCSKEGWATERRAATIAEIRLACEEEMAWTSLHRAGVQAMTMMQKIKIGAAAVRTAADEAVAVARQADKDAHSLVGAQRVVKETAQTLLADVAEVLIEVGRWSQERVYRDSPAQKQAAMWAMVQRKVEVLAQQDTYEVAITMAQCAAVQEEGMARTFASMGFDAGCIKSALTLADKFVESSHRARPGVEVSSREELAAHILATVPALHDMGFDSDLAELQAAGISLEEVAASMLLDSYA